MCLFPNTEIHTLEIPFNETVLVRAIRFIENSIHRKLDKLKIKADFCEKKGILSFKSI